MKQFDNNLLLLYPACSLHDTCKCPVLFFFFSLFFHHFTSFLHQIHVNYYFTSTTIYMRIYSKQQASSRTKSSKWELRIEKKKSNEKTRIVQSIVSCLSAHTACSKRERDAVAFLTSFTDLRYEHWTHRQTHNASEMRELKMQAASCRNLFRWTCEIANWNGGGLKWDEVTFEVKILIYGQFQNSGLPSYIFPSSTSFRAGIREILWMMMIISFVLLLMLKIYIY